MAKEPSLDFIQSISKFKKSFTKKKSGNANYKTRLKMLDDFLITKNFLENGNYKTILNDPGQEQELKEQITHRISRYRFFLESLPEQILIPKDLYDSFKDKDDIYKYFISFRRKNAVVHHLVDSPTENELATAMKIMDNFYNIHNAGFDKKYWVIQRIHIDDC